MNKLNRRISELIIQKATWKLQLNGNYNMNSTYNPSYIYDRVGKINTELRKLCLYRARLEKLQQLKNKINDKQGN